MSQAKPTSDSIELPEPTASIEHSDSLKHAARVLAEQLNDTYSDNDVTVEEITVNDASYKDYDAIITLEEGASFSDVIAEIALEDTDYDYASMIVYGGTGRIGVHVSRIGEDGEE